MSTTTDDRPTSAFQPGELLPVAPSPTVARDARSRRATAASVSASSRKVPSLDQYLASQVSLAMAVALIFGMIAFAAGRMMPALAPSGGAAAPAAASANTSAAGAMITSFSSGTAAQQVQVAADPTGALKWDKATYEVQAGDVTFVVTNKSVITHNFAVEGGNVKVQSPNFGANTTNSYTIKGLTPGEYTIVCTFPGHRESGMVAKLIVH